MIPTMTMQSSSTHAPYSPAIMSLLPLLYVGWSDRNLSLAELDLLKSKVAGMKWLSDADKALLMRWGNPKNPPSPGSLIRSRWSKKITAR